MKKNVIIITTLALILSVAAGANAYNPKPPAALNVEMRLYSSSPCNSRYTLALAFRNHSNSEIVIPVEMVEGSNCHYEGTVTSAGNADLKSLANLNNRSYWDKMYLLNNGGTSNNLRIRKFQVRAQYGGDPEDLYNDPQNDLRRNPLISGLMSSKTLTGRTGRLELANWKMRACFACDYLHSQGIMPNDCTSRFEVSQCVSDINAMFPPWTRKYFYDLGKTGSDLAEDGNYFSKYGEDGALCSETTTWYYAEYADLAEDADGEEFYEDILGSSRTRNNYGGVRSAFENEGSLFCYHKNNIDRKWYWQQCNVIGDKGDIVDGKCIHWGSDTIQPKAGDVLIRTGTKAGHGHTMMVVDWDDRTNIVQPIEGPVPVQFRAPIDMDTVDLNKYEFCVGQIPDNE